ncbi:hypothetical protein INR49_009631 [Caranx melampygus]|nr:hypothetical protein INR49_009631 [Caranx melampygus]
MEQFLSLLVVLAMVWSCRSWQAPDFCHQSECPEYQVVGSHQGFEERLYVATDWITTKIDSSADSDVVAANSRLKDYCESQKSAGYDIPTDTWPALITATTGEDSLSLSLSWFVPPGVKKPQNDDPLVTVESRPAATVYVRTFGGIPSLSSGQTNAELLRQALTQAGKTFNAHIYTGAGYDSFFSVTHHNEIWIYAA